MAMPYMGLRGLDWVSFCDCAQITAPLVPAAVAGVVATLRMPRLMAPSACHSSPSEGSTLALELGTILPGTPSFSYPAVVRKFLWPPWVPTITSEPTRLAPPARSKQIKGTPPAAVGTLHCPGPSMAWMSASRAAPAGRDLSSAASHAGANTMACEESI